MTLQAKHEYRKTKMGKSMLTHELILAMMSGEELSP